MSVKVPELLSQSLGVDDHRTELWKPEFPASSTHAHLPEEHGAAVRQFDAGGDDQKQRNQQDKSRERDGDINESLQSFGSADRCGLGRLRMAVVADEMRTD